MTVSSLRVIVNLQGEERNPHPLTTWETWLQTWLTHLPDELPQADAYELSIRFTDDLEIQNLNYQYRQKNQPTDVLAFAALEVNFPTFPQAVTEEAEPLYLGDIVISVETAQRQATSTGHSLSTELVWLTAHGFLHLLGWDHPDDESLREMLSQQELLLTMVGIFSE